jgi:cytochrome P450
MSAPEIVDFPSAQLNECPYPFYEQGRETQPVQPVPERNEVRLFKHEDVAWVLQNEQHFSAYMPQSNASQGLDYEGAVHVGADDGDRHKLNRKLLSRPFTPGRLRGYEATISEHVTTLIERFLERGSVELSGEFSNPLPAMVISSLMGLPTEGEDFVFLQQWNDGFTRGTDLSGEEMERMHAYMASEVEKRAAHPTDDILSELMQRQTERDGELDRALANTLGIEMIAGGVITTGQLITNTMLLLLQAPDQLERVRADHTLIPGTLEESLRVETPVQWRQRVALHDLEIGGVAVPEGALVTMMMASGNRDDDTFECPADFRVGRRNIKRHFGFGLGLHFCVGAPLARLEGKLAFEQLLPRMQDIELVGYEETLRNIDSPIFRRPRELHLRFTAA